MSSRTQKNLQTSFPSSSPTHEHIQGFKGLHRAPPVAEIAEQNAHVELHHCYNPTNARTHRQAHLLSQTEIPIKKFSPQLKKIYNTYASRDRKYLKSGDYHHLEESQYLLFCNNYKISPTLSSLVELREIFRVSTKKLTHVDRHMHNEEKTTTFSDFIMCLVLIAHKVFSGDKWDKKFPHNKQKFMLLLFWMDQKSEVFLGNGADLMVKVNLNRKVEMEMSARMDFGNGGEIFFEKFPTLRGIDLEMKSIFYHYCMLADRLNCGPSACMSRQQFVKLFEDGGIFEKNIKAAQLSILFQKHLVDKEKRLRFENFYDAVASAGVLKFSKTKLLINAKSKFHEPGVALRELLTENLLPLSAQVAAVSYSARNRTGAGERRHSEVRASEWMTRWKGIEILREGLKGEEVLEFFGVHHRYEDEKTSNSSNSSSSSSRSSGSSGEIYSESESSDGDSGIESSESGVQPGEEKEIQLQTSTKRNRVSELSLISLKEENSSAIVKSVTELTEKVAALQLSISMLDEEKNVRKVEILSPTPSQAPTPTPQSLIGRSPYRASMPSLGLFRFQQAAAMMLRTPPPQQTVVVPQPQAWLETKKLSTDFDDADSLVSVEINKGFEFDGEEEGEFGDLGSVISNLEDHMTDFVRRNSTAVLEQEQEQEQNDDKISMLSLSQSLSMMKTECDKVEEKQRRRGGSLHGPEPVEVEVVVKVEEMGGGEFESASANDNYSLASDDNDYVHSSPIHSPGPRFYNNNNNNNGNKKGCDPVPSDFKNAIDSVMSQFSNQFAAIEAQIETLNNNMKQIGETSKLKRERENYCSPTVALTSIAKNHSPKDKEEEEEGGGGATTITKITKTTPNTNRTQRPADKSPLDSEHCKHRVELLEQEPSLQHVL